MAIEPADQAERDLVVGLDDDRDRHKRLVQRRIAEQRCPFPIAAQYLVDHYDMLNSRRPKGRPMSAFGRKWWEYLWPRDTSAMLATPKLIGPRLTRWPRFALDEDGLLPTDSCVALNAPESAQGRSLLRRLRRELEVALGSISSRELLLYVMAFLNATPARGGLAHRTPADRKRRLDRRRGLLVQSALGGTRRHRSRAGDTRRRRPARHPRSNAGGDYG